ncbi:MAG: DUF4013 domain-containing protein [Methanobrevibacter sp.]|nr:DUF4013 domain-containing protein [Methanobrevibacter sp.]
MNTKETIIDSAKYSFKVKRSFLFLGFLFWALSHNFRVILNENFSLAMFLIIPLMLFTFIEGGYLATIIEDTIFGLNIQPKFENYKNLIFKGIKEVLIVFIYSIIPIFTLIVLLIFDSALFTFNIANLILFSLFIFLLFCSFIVLQGAIIHYEYSHAKFKTAFEFRLILRKLRSMGVNRFITSFSMLTLILVFIIPITTGITEEVHPIISIIMEFTILPFLAIFSSRLLGLIGKHHFI